MRVIAIIQARLDSARLPGKVTKLIEGKAMLTRVYERARSIRGIDEVVIAIPHDDSDLNVWIRDTLGVCPATSSTHNVLRRYYVTALSREAEVVVRLTGDCPLLDPDESARVLDGFLAGGYDLADNVGAATDGFDTEVFSFGLLDAAHRYAATVEDVEHVTPWMRRQPDLQRLHLPLDGPAIKLSVDTLEDLALVRSVYAKVGRDRFSRAEAIEAAVAITTRG